MDPSAAAGPDLEGLGAFYLGRTVEPASRTVTGEPLLYDARDLTTHAVCLGMTGSGKTGLCLSLLEEAALDGIPAIAVDPKGDLANLLLTFPDLAPADFLPWVDAGEAARKGLDPEAWAARVAETWRSGLERWGQDGDRIRRMRTATPVSVYTPGASGGAPLSVLRSLTAPADGLADDPDAFRDRVVSTVSGLLTLLGRDPDPVASREHILLSRILEEAWGRGESVELPRLIARIQDPPFRTLGVMELDTVIPPDDRGRLALALNNLLASPTFAPWAEGEPLDVGALLRTRDGGPRISVLSIAHLSEAQRTFFLTLLFNEVVTWVRRQSGTSSLRALLYIDEVAGMLPPVAEPPTKAPLLTLFKQARAFGVGVMVATQNPVDLDYKALSNAGTWFLGRLQTERDKARVMDGLRAAGGAAQGLEPGELDRILSGLESRVFLMQNAHEPAPVLFHTRWAMSYLRGPLTRSQLNALAREGREERAGAGTDPGPDPRGIPDPLDREADTEESAAPGRGLDLVLPPEADEGHATPTRPLPAGTTVIHRPALWARVRLHWADGRRKLDRWGERAVLAWLPPGTDTEVGPRIWEEARTVERSVEVVDGAPDGPCLELPAEVGGAAAWATWSEALEDHARRAFPLSLWKAEAVDLRSEPGETEGDVRARALQALRERRDREVSRLRERHGRKLRTAEDRVRRAEDRVARESAQLGERRLDTALTAGAAVLDAFLGRRRRSSLGRATRAVKGAGRIRREADDVERAEEDLDRARERLEELMATLEAEVAELHARFDPAALTLEESRIAPRASDLQILELRLLWVPWGVTPDRTVVELVPLE